MIGNHLRMVPPSYSSVDDEEAGFTIAILQEAERDAPPPERRLPGRGWMGDAQAEADINMMMTATRAVRKQQEADTQDSQLNELSSEKTRTFTGSATLHTKCSLEKKFRVLRRICTSAVRGGLSSPSSS